MSCICKTQSYTFHAQHLHCIVNTEKFGIVPLFYNDMHELLSVYQILNVHYWALAVAKGFFNTKITESPRRNIFAIYLSLLIGFAFLPFPVLGISYHISLTFSKTILQCLSNAFTRPNNFLLFRQLINTCVLFFTDVINTDNGPVLNSSSSRCFNSSNVSSDLGLFSNLKENDAKNWCKQMLYHYYGWSHHNFLKHCWSIFLCIWLRHLFNNFNHCQQKKITKKRSVKTLFSLIMGYKTDL